MKWLYKDKIINGHSDLHPDCTDIVYLLTYEDGTKYVGKKTIASIRRIKPTKAQLAIRKNYVRKELKKLSFLKYEGSSLENKDKVLVEKRILHQCGDKRSATYMELVEIITREALFIKEYNNKNALGAFFDNVLDNYLEGDKDDRN